MAATLAHNLLRWTAIFGLGVREQQTVAKTLRRTLLSLPGRLTRSARRWTLHLPASWPWAHSFQMALRCIPHPTSPAPSAATADRRHAEPPSLRRHWRYPRSRLATTTAKQQADAENVHI